MDSSSKAIAHLRAGLYDAAVRELEAVAADSPLGPNDCIILSVALQRSGRNAESVALLDRLDDAEFSDWIESLEELDAEDGVGSEVPLPPENVWLPLKQKILASLRKRDFDAACRLARHAANTMASGEQAEAQVTLARCLGIAGRDVEAYQEYIKALHLSPPSSELFVRAGICAFRCEYYGRADRYLSIARHLHMLIAQQRGADGPKFFMQKALIEMRLKIWPRALNSLRSALASKEGDIQIIGHLAYVEMQLNRSEDALVRFTAIGPTIVDWPEIWLWKIQAQRRCGLQAQASKEASALCARYPDNALAMLLLGDLAMAQGEYNRAIDCFEVLSERLATESITGMTLQELEQRTETCRSALGIVAFPSESTTSCPLESTQPTVTSVFHPRYRPGGTGNLLPVRSMLAQQFRVVHALLLRDMRARFSRNKLGYLWALIEPVMQVLVLYIIFLARGRLDINGLPLIIFLSIGVIAFSFMQNGYSSTTQAIASSRPLLMYPPVTIFDIMISKVILQFLTSITVLFVVMLGIRIYGIEFPVKDPIMVLLSLTLLTLFGAGVGMIVSAISTVFHSVNMIFNQIMRLLFFTSGVFFAINDLPKDILYYALYNPLIHFIEFIRFNFSNGIIESAIDLRYAATCVVFILFLGLIFNGAFRQRILSS